MPETAVLDGAVGEDTFTIRYAAPGGIVRVMGQVRGSSQGSRMLLRFREERLSGGKVVASLVLGGVTAYLLRAGVENWIELAVAGVTGLAILLFPAGTSPGFAEAVCGQLVEEVGQQ